MNAPDLLAISELDRDALRAILDLSARADLGRPLAERGVALVFQKPSARTRSSMELAVAGLGGHPVAIQDREIGLGGGRESVEDVARTLAAYHAVIAARVFDHAVLEAMAAAVETPVVNLLSDRAHPMQTLADLLTLRELFGALEGLRVAYVGDVNNVARSLAAGCARMGVRLAIAAPEGVGPGLDAPGDFGGLVRRTADPAEAVEGARAVYTDTWVSMGEEAEGEARRARLRPYQVDEALMARAAEGARFLHCLPAHRGEEVTAQVIDGPRSAVWIQARNRLRTARGALAWVLGARP